MVAWSFAASPPFRKVLGEHLHEPWYLSSVVALCFLGNLSTIFDPMVLPVEVLVVATLGVTGGVIVATEHYVVKCCCFGLGRTCLQGLAERHLHQYPLMKSIDLTLQDRYAIITICLLFVSVLPGTTLAYAISVTHVGWGHFLIGNVAATVKSITLRIALALAGETISQAMRGQIIPLQTIVGLAAAIASVAGFGLLGIQATRRLRELENDAEASVSVSWVTHSQRETDKGTCQN